MNVLLGVVVHRESGQLPVLPVHEGCPGLGEDIGPPALRYECQVPARAASKTTTTAGSNRLNTCSQCRRSRNGL